MSEIENPPAFACASADGHQTGMTLRDWFAGQALGKMAGNDDTVARASWTANPEEHLATWAYRIADAMLAARTNKGSAQ